MPLCIPKAHFTIRHPVDSGDDGIVEKAYGQDLRTSITTGYSHKIDMNIYLKSATDPKTGQSSGLAVRETAKSLIRSFLNKSHATP